MAVALGTALLSGCAAQGPDGGGSGTAAPTGGTAAAPTTTLRPLRTPSERCGAEPEPAATPIRLTARDGTRLSAVAAGGGKAGVLLIHQYRDDLCGVWRYGAYLVDRGFQVLAIDVRCFGLSECPDGPARGDVLDDVDTGLAELRRRGATRVAVVGGSMGGTMALLAGALSSEPPDAVVSLSGGSTDLGELLGGARKLRAEDVADRIRTPVLLVAAPEDRDAVGINRALHRAIAAEDKRLLVLPDGESGLHAFAMLIDYGDVGKLRPAAAEVAGFLRAHLAPTAS